MSELIVYKANELAVSRYDLTEQETKLLLYCVGLIDPSVENLSREQRTCIVRASDYASYFDDDIYKTYKNIKNACDNLTDRKIEIIYPEGAIEKHIFHWINSAKYNRELKEIELVFSEDIQPFLYQLKKFIKYNLEHVKKFKNKYSVRVYEFLLKELTQRKVKKSAIEISIDDFKYMLMLENNYSDLRNFTSKFLAKITDDINTFSNMRINISKSGRPANKLIFSVEIEHQNEKQIDFVSDINKTRSKTQQNAREQAKINKVIDDYAKIEKLLTINSMHKITLSDFEHKFLLDMKEKYQLTCSFDFLSEKQRKTLNQILNKYIGNK